MMTATVAKPCITRPGRRVSPGRTPAENGAACPLGARWVVVRRIAGRHHPVAGQATTGSTAAPEKNVISGDAGAGAGTAHADDARDAMRPAEPRDDPEIGAVLATGEQVRARSPIP